jgi:DamX protein
METAPTPTTTVAQDARRAPQAPARAQENTPAATPRQERPARTSAPEAPLVYQQAETRADLVWLSEQNPEHFTIQLIALTKVAAVEEFLQTNAVEGAYIIPTGALVIAVHGSYPDMESAMTGLSSLPLRVVAQGYWIRSIGDVKKDARR